MCPPVQMVSNECWIEALTKLWSELTLRLQVIGSAFKFTLQGTNRLAVSELRLLNSPSKCLKSLSLTLYNPII